jgi:hypothetical protein
MVSRLFAMIQIPFNSALGLEFPNLALPIRFNPFGR